MLPAIYTVSVFGKDVPLYFCFCLWENKAAADCRRLSTFSVRFLPEIIQIDSRIRQSYRETK